MSVYVSQETVIRDINLLCEALDAVGIEYKRYPQADGVYRKWAMNDYYNERGKVRGANATVVVHGGLDTTPRRYCGDTAFIVEADGSVRIELDQAHGNAAEHWRAIQANYQALRLERVAKQRGFRCQRVEESPGRIKLRILGIEPPAQGRQLASRRVRA